MGTLSRIKLNKYMENLTEHQAMQLDEHQLIILDALKVLGGRRSYIDSYPSHEELEEWTQFFEDSPKWYRTKTGYTTGGISCDYPQTPCELFRISKRDTPGLLPNDPMHNIKPCATYRENCVLLQEHHIREKKAREEFRFWKELVHAIMDVLKKGRLF